VWSGKVHECFRYNVINASAVPRSIVNGTALAFGPVIFPTPSPTRRTHTYIYIHTRISYYIRHDIRLARDTSRWIDARVSPDNIIREIIITRVVRSVVNDNSGRSKTSSYVLTYIYIFYRDRKSECSTRSVTKTFSGRATYFSASNSTARAPNLLSPSRTPVSFLRSFRIFVVNHGKHRDLASYARERSAYLMRGISRTGRTLISGYSSKTFSLWKSAEEGRTSFSE